MKMKNRIVFITGASSGIGAACAQQFAAAGATLILCARRLEKVTALAEQLRRDYQVMCHSVKLDVTQYAEIANVVNHLPPAYSSIDILINNAGLAAGLDTIQDADIQDWEAMIDTNIKGLLYVTKMIVPKMLAKNHGHIFNIGSIAGHHVYPKGAVYCATKYAVHALSQGLRMDLFGSKIRVTSIDPGAVKTNFSRVRFKGAGEKAEAVYEGMQPLSAEDIADTIFFCATRPAHVNISEVIIMPTDQAAIAMVARQPQENQK